MLNLRVIFVTILKFVTFGFRLLSRLSDFYRLFDRKLRSIGLLARKAYFNSIFCQDHAIL